MSEAQLEDLQTCGTCVIADSLADVKAEVDQRAYASVKPILVEEGYRGFNILSYDGAWYGLEQAEGAFDPAKVEKQQYVRCFRSTRKEELKEILRTEHSKAEAERAARLLLPQLVEEDYRGFNIISCSGAYYGIRPAEGAFAIESVMARTYKELFHEATLDGLKAEIDKAASAPLPQLVEEGYCGFNIILYDGTWYGLAQGEEAFDPANVDQGQRGRCFASSSKESLKEILRIAASAKAERERGAHIPVPQLIEEGYCGFNIISYDGTWYALPQGEGEFDPEKVKKQQYARCFVSGSKEQLKEILAN